MGKTIKEVSLHDLPIVLGAAVKVLKNYGIGRVHPQAVFVEDDGSIQIVLEYFKALENLPCECVRVFQDAQAEYHRLNFCSGSITFSFDKPVEFFGSRRLG